MLKRLENLYLNPNHWGYFYFETISRHWLKINALLLITLCAYPLIQTFQAHYRHQYLQASLEQKQENLQQQHKLLESLQNLNREKNQQDGQLAILNQKIKELIDQEKAKIETLQWRFDSGKQIELVLQQQSPKVFSLIEQLIMMNSLNFKSLSLLKLNQQKLVQINAEILVQ